jgi:hypothetical protein
VQTAETQRDPTGKVAVVTVSGGRAVAAVEVDGGAEHACVARAAYRHLA